MIDGDLLASQAKHTPELIDPDEVREAGRTIETFSNLLSGITSWKVLEGEHVFTFTVDSETARQVLFFAFGE